MSLKKLFLEFNKQDFGRLSDFLEEHYFHLVYDRHDKLGYSKYYVGGGSRAQVYASDKHPDVVLRITEYSSESEDYEKLVGKKFDHVVNVLFHKEVRFGIITVMEKLEKLSYDIEDDIYDVLLTLKNDYAGGVRSHEVYDILSNNRYIFRQVLSSIDNFQTSREEVVKYFTDIFKGIKELASVGIEHQDMHTGNVMKDPKTGNYKIIDISF